MLRRSWPREIHKLRRPGYRYRIGCCRLQVRLSCFHPSQLIPLRMNGWAGAHISAIANQESLSIMEVEMRKLEASVKEIMEEMSYLQRREMKMRDTNGASLPLHSASSAPPGLPVDESAAGRRVLMWQKARITESRTFLFSLH